MKLIPIPKIKYLDLDLRNIGPVKQFLGVSTLDPYNLEIGTATDMKNLTASGGVSPSLITRPAFSLVGASFGAPVRGMGLHLNKELHAVAGGQWRRFNNGSWATLASSLNSSAQWSFVNFKGNLAGINLIGVNGVDAPKKYDGSSITNLTGLPSGVNFKMIDQHDNRLYASDGKLIYFSAIAKPQDWTSTGESGAGQIAVETETGEDVLAIKAGIKHVLIFKRNAFIELWGTRPSNFQMQRIAETGSVGLNAVTVKDQTAYWMHDSGPFRYTGGLPRNDFALPMIGYFQRMNKASASIACTVSTGDSVLFSFPTGTSTVNDTTLEYLPNFNIWTVWKDFAPTSWLYWNSVLTYGDATGVYQATNSATNVNWQWISPPFGGGIFSNRHQWYKMWYILEVPAGSTLNVYVSNKAEGNDPTDWIPVSSVAYSSSVKKVFIPLADLANSNWMRVKFEGTGYVRFHEFNIQQREMPLH